MYSQIDASRKEMLLPCVHPGAWNDDIECHLKTVSLNDNPRFHGTSYVWGDFRIKMRITIDGNPLETTRNRFMRLQRLRKTDKEPIIYTDAACINPSDLNERSEQVQLMGEIHSSAEEGLIWLGYGRDNEAPLQRATVYHSNGDDNDTQMMDAYFEQILDPKDENEKDDERKEDVLGLFVFLEPRALNRHLYEMPFFTVDRDRTYTKDTWRWLVLAIQWYCNGPKNELYTEEAWAAIVRAIETDVSF